MIPDSYYLIKSNYYHDYHINFILFVFHHGKEVELAVEAVMNGSLDWIFSKFFIISFHSSSVILIDVSE